MLPPSVCWCAADVWCCCHHHQRYYFVDVSIARQSAEWVNVVLMSLPQSSYPHLYIYRCVCVCQQLNELFIFPLFICATNFCHVVCCIIQVDVDLPPPPPLCVDNVAVYLLLQTIAYEWFRFGKDSRFKLNQMKLHFRELFFRFYFFFFFSTQNCAFLFLVIWFGLFVAMFGRRWNLKNYTRSQIK